MAKSSSNNIKPSLLYRFPAIFTIATLFSTPLFATSTYLQAKQYLDVSSGELIHPANILIEDGVIKAINPKRKPADATVINKPNLTLLPGLMDAHVHITCDMSKDWAMDTVQDGAGESTLRGVKNAKMLLLAGFTTIRDLDQCYPGDSFTTVALSKASEQGWIDAPHIIPAGHALSITGGHMDPDMFGAFAPGVLPVNYRNGVADGIDEVVKAVRYQIKYGAKVIKVGATAGVLSSEESVGNQQYSFDELKAIVDEAKRHHIPVTVHAHGTEGINASIRAGVNSVEHGSMIDDESIRLMKENGIFLVPTTYLTKSIDLNILSPNTRKKAEYIIPIARQHIAKAIRAGVKIVLGTDTPVFPHGQNAKELASLVELGMTPLGAIRAATINAAELFQLKNRGQIKVGYDADIVGVDRNPLSNISILENVNFVMKDGKVYKS